MMSILRTAFFIVMADLRWGFRFWLHRVACIAHALQPPIRARRDMSATALNDRRCAGTRCSGFLGQPAVVMLG